MIEVPHFKNLLIKDWKKCTVIRTIVNSLNWCDRGHPIVSMGTLPLLVHGPMMTVRHPAQRAGSVGHTGVSQTWRSRLLPCLLMWSAEWDPVDRVALKIFEEHSFFLNSLLCGTLKIDCLVGVFQNFLCLFLGYMSLAEQIHVHRQYLGATEVKNRIYNQIALV